MKVNDKFKLSSENGYIYDCEVISVKDFRKPDMKYCIDIFLGGEYIGESFFIGDDFFDKYKDRIEIIK